MATSVVVPAGCVVRDEARHIQGHVDAGLVDQGRAAVVRLSCRSQKELLVQANVNTNDKNTSRPNQYANKTHKVYRRGDRAIGKDTILVYYISHRTH